MNPGAGHEYRNAFGALRQFARRSRSEERCELCSAAVAATHQHLIDPKTRRLLCACDACAILFSAWSGTYRRVPRDIRFLPDFHIEDAQWESLMIPINLAFIFYSSESSKVIALYPSPAGATESMLPL